MAASGKTLASVTTSVTTSTTIRCKRRHRQIVAVKTFRPRPSGKPSTPVSGGGR
jgi:hypothetical protein